MDYGDLAGLVGLYMGSFALGWCSGFLYLTFRKVAETAT